MTPGRRAAPLAAVLGLALVSGCSPSPSSAGWQEAFGYAPSQVHEVEIGAFGCPVAPVSVDGRTFGLPFDTGNMVGLSLSTALYDELAPEPSGSYVRRNSAGEDVGTLRVGRARGVTFLGRDLGSLPVHELAHPDLPGLAGPILLGGGRFTLDYGARRLAVGGASPSGDVAGFRRLPLVRSGRHAMLILVRGSVEGREVLVEIDTGKSRSVVSPVLAEELGLRRVEGGVRVERFGLGDLSFRVPSAKEVAQTAIDPDLPEPILAGVGSDILSRFPWTVDYEAGALWLPETP